MANVYLRKKKIKGDRYSLFLEYYPPVRNPTTMKPVHKESLGIYVYANPKTKEEKAYVEEMWDKSQIIRNDRYRSVVNEEYNFLDKKKFKGDLLAHFYKECLKRTARWLCIYDHFYNFIGGRCTFEEITVNLCKRFKEHLLNAKHLDDPTQTLCQNTASGYYRTFRGYLDMLLKERLLKENVNEYLEKIPKTETERGYLTKEDLVKLYHTDCDYEIVKAASFFSFLTGLRRSDIMSLRWENIVIAVDGGNCIRKGLIKTGAKITLPISEEALEFCGERKESGLVFEDLKLHWLEGPFKRWVKKAGINRHITFHCLRHTFATLQLNEGTNLYVVKEMLGHRSITSTEVYTKVIDKSKRDSAEVLSIKKMIENKDLKDA